MTDRQAAMLQDVLDAFNRHDLDAIMSYFTEECVFETPRGPDRWGRRFAGKDEVTHGRRSNGPPSGSSRTGRSPRRPACRHEPSNTPAPAADPRSPTETPW
jgi:hypothetical protein